MTLTYEQLSNYLLIATLFGMVLGAVVAYFGFKSGMKKALDKYRK